MLKEEKKDLEVEFDEKMKKLEEEHRKRITELEQQHHKKVGSAVSQFLMLAACSLGSAHMLPRWPSHAGDARSGSVPFHRAADAF